MWSLRRHRKRDRKSAKTREPLKKRIPGRREPVKKKSAKATRQESNGEFDPGSGRTLAACLTHASRTKTIEELALIWF